MAKRCKNDGLQRKEVRAALCILCFACLYLMYLEECDYLASTKGSKGVLPSADIATEIHRFQQKNTFLMVDFPGQLCQSTREYPYFSSRNTKHLARLNLLLCRCHFYCRLRYVWNFGTDLFRQKLRRNKTTTGGSGIFTTPSVNKLLI